jgi:hypothetical protein
MEGVFIMVGRCGDWDQNLGFNSFVCWYCSYVLSRHFNRRTSPLVHFFFRRPKFQFPPLDFGAVAQVLYI